MTDNKDSRITPLDLLEYALFCIEQADPDFDQDRPIKDYVTSLPETEPLRQFWRMNFQCEDCSQLTTLDSEGFRFTFLAGGCITALCPSCHSDDSLRFCPPPQIAQIMKEIVDGKRS